MWKDIGGNQEGILSIEKFGGYKRGAKERKEIRERKASAKEQGKRGGTLQDSRRVRRRNRNENVSARPNGLRDNAETVISCREPGPARKKKEVYH